MVLDSRRTRNVQYRENVLDRTSACAARRRLAFAWLEFHIDPCIILSEISNKNFTLVARGSRPRSLRMLKIFAWERRCWKTFFEEISWDFNIRVRTGNKRIRVEESFSNSENVWALYLRFLRDKLSSEL